MTAIKRCHYTNDKRQNYEINNDITQTPLPTHMNENKQNKNRRRQAAFRAPRIKLIEELRRNGCITPNCHGAIGILLVSRCFLFDRQTDGVFIVAIENPHRICVDIEPTGQLESFREVFAADHNRCGSRCFIHFTTQPHAYECCEGVVEKIGSGNSRKKHLQFGNIGHNSREYLISCISSNERIW